MNYSFYGKHVVSSHKPVKSRNPHDYSILNYNIEYTEDVKWECFFETDKYPKELKEGQKIILGGEEVIITEIIPNLDQNNFHCYTTKILSHEIGMSEEKARKYLRTMKSYDEIDGMSLEKAIQYLRDVYGANI